MTTGQKITAGVTIALAGSGASFAAAVNLFPGQATLITAIGALISTIGGLLLVIFKKD